MAYTLNPDVEMTLRPFTDDAPSARSQRRVARLDQRYGAAQRALLALAMLHETADEATWHRGFVHLTRMLDQFAATAYSMEQELMKANLELRFAVSLSTPADPDPETAPA